MATRLIRRSSSATTARECWRLLIRGRVQGIGFRPAIARTAQQFDVQGFVRNTPLGVEILVHGSAASVQAFLRVWQQHLPMAAVLEDVTIQALPGDSSASAGFFIVDSDTHGPMVAHPPLDVRTCDPCIAETLVASDDPHATRRSGYAFTSCTECGPRYTIVASLPFDRLRTTLRDFALCESCAREMIDVQDRRFHSQTNNCPACGPRLWAMDPVDGAVWHHVQAVERAAQAVRAGSVLALKGLGGYQWLVDATNPVAVARLRQLKRRPSKPFAIMVPDVHAAARWAQLSPAQCATLTHPVNPIVIVRQQPTADLPREVTSGLSTVGIMLPTTPLHALLLRGADRPLIVTSTNREGEPMEYRPTPGGSSVVWASDLVLDHDRPIARPLDDSVVQVVGDHTMSLRNARGLAPLPLSLPVEDTLLALGGEMKSAFAVADRQRAYLGPHLGDLGSVAGQSRYLEQLDAFQRLTETSNPVWVVHDAHPDYFTTHLAQNWKQTRPVSIIPVQHHHAHIAAGMLEAGWLDRTVLGVAWDGTGYGTDGQVWGGEFLICRAADFQRVGRLRPFPLVGGEWAVTQPWRVALALVHEAAGHEAARCLNFPAVDTLRQHQVRTLLAQQYPCQLTTSMGRLCDGVAAILLDLSDATFEAEPAMRCESICDPGEKGRYPFPIEMWELDWRPLVRALLKDRAEGVSAARMATRFHRALVGGIVDMMHQYPTLPLVMSGGVFQNGFLLAALREALMEWPPGIHWPGWIPVNDGGLAVGQLAVAAAKLAGNKLAGHARLKG